MKKCVGGIIFVLLLLTILIGPAIQNTYAGDSGEGGISIMQRPETIRISEKGRIYVEGRETRLNRMARRLRREGYDEEDTIYVSIPQRAPRRVLVSVGRELASHGYRRVIFTRPPRATSEAEGEESE